MSDRPESAQEILDEMARSFGDCNINILIKDLEYLAMKEKQYEAKAAEKAKADKLAMLSDINETLEGMSELVTKDGVSMFWVKLFDWGNKLDQLKQRIEDE